MFFPHDMHPLLPERERTPERTMTTFAKLPMMRPKTKYAVREKEIIYMSLACKIPPEAGFCMPYILFLPLRSLAVRGVSAIQASYRVGVNVIVENRVRGILKR